MLKQAFRELSLAQEGDGDCDHPVYGCGERNCVCVDERNATRVCTQCGHVYELQELLVQVSLEHAAMSLSIPIRGPSAPYNRRYHWNERIAQRQATDPVVPRAVVDLLETHILKDPKYAKTDIRWLTQEDITSSLRAIKPNFIMLEDGTPYKLKNACEHWYFNYV